MINVVTLLLRYIDPPPPPESKWPQETENVTRSRVSTMMTPTNWFNWFLANFVRMLSNKKYWLMITISAKISVFGVVRI